MEENEPKFELKETFKLVKNSKGYTWEIRTFINDNDEVAFVRLRKINERFVEQYGGEQ
jgi:hypothetical protein